MIAETLLQFKQSDRYTTVMQRSLSKNSSVLPVVQTIMDTVQREGDAALLNYTQQFDNATITTLRVSKEAIKQAYAQVDPGLVDALQRATANIRAVHAQQIPQDSEQAVEPISGVEVWHTWKPIERVGLYIPGGKAVYPSSVLMTGIPAQLAGCKQVVMVTPPQSNGPNKNFVSPSLLVAADIAGITEIYTVGGAQAIAALAYGTESIPKVSKIFGPGNAYVAAAKLLAYSQGDVAIDSPAGPSEVLVLADETANPAWVAADIICDTEHGDDSAGVLVTTSETLAQAVIKEIEKQLTDLPTAERVCTSLQTYGAFVVTKSLTEAIEFAKEYASEHTLVVTAEAREVAEQITNAGSVFIGPYACKAAGDYATGANHVLPTGGTAKMFSGLSTLDFMKLVEYQSVSKAGLTALRSTIETLATEEQLPAHKNSCAIRFEQPS